MVKVLQVSFLSTPSQPLVSGVEGPGRIEHRKYLKWLGAVNSWSFLKTWFLWEGTLQELCGIGQRSWITILSSTRNVPVPNCKQCEDTKGQWFWCWKAWGQNQGRDYTTPYDMGEWWPWAARFVNWCMAPHLKAEICKMNCLWNGKPCSHRALGFYQVTHQEEEWACGFHWASGWIQVRLAIS